LTQIRWRELSGSPRTSALKRCTPCQKILFDQYSAYGNGAR